MQCSVTFQSSGGAFVVGFREENQSFTAVFDGAAAAQGYLDYRGSYDVTPMVTSQRLETEDRHMLEDVLIRTIPTRETANPAGGTTFTIGG